MTSRINTQDDLQLRKIEDICFFHPQTNCYGQCKLCNNAPAVCTWCNDQSVLACCCCCGEDGVQFAKCDKTKCLGFYKHCFQCRHEFYYCSSNILTYTEYQKMEHSCKKHKFILIPLITIT